MRTVTQCKALKAKADEKKEFHVPGDDNELPRVMALLLGYWGGDYEG